MLYKIMAKKKWLRNSHLNLKLHISWLISKFCHCIWIWPLIFHTCHFFLLNPYWSINFVRLLAKVWLVIFIALNNPIVICLGYQLHPKELITKAKISCASWTCISQNLLLQIYNLPILVKHIFVSFFPPILYIKAIVVSVCLYVWAMPRRFFQSLPVPQK